MGRKRKAENRGGTTKEDKNGNCSLPKKKDSNTCLETFELPTSSKEPIPGKRDGKSPLIQKVSTVPVSNERKLKEKIGQLALAFEEFMSEVNGVPDEVPSSELGLDYKHLYEESEKKVEGLMLENCDLIRKLEFARGQNEAYKNMTDIMLASKDGNNTISDLENVTKATSSLPPQETSPVQNDQDAPAAATTNEVDDQDTPAAATTSRRTLSDRRKKRIKS